MTVLDLLTIPLGAFLYRVLPCFAIATALLNSGQDGRLQHQRKKWHSPAHNKMA